MFKTVFAASLIASLAAGAAHAQQTAPAQTAPAKPAPTTTAPAATAPATTAAKSASKALAGAMLGTQVWKQAVYDAKENRIGEIDNLVIGANGQIQEAVVGVGGFLGIGEKAVALPYSALKPMVRDGMIWFQVDKSKEDLKAMPTFDTSKYKH